MQKGLCKKCEKKVTPITFGDFDTALKDIVNEGAQDPSMATANMVKEWSMEVRQFVYTNMSALRQMQENPQ
jgi:hypothetical protein